jgi:hypothetical protein
MMSGKSVWNIESKDCVEREKEIALEQYKLYVEMADKISERRTHANNFFVTLNSSLITVYGIATAKDSIIQGGPWLWLVPIAGIAICLLWSEIIRSYRDINTAKFKVMHEVEERLPLALYKYEWEVAKHGDGSKYRPTSHIEMWVPWVFGALYLIIGIAQLLPALCWLTEKLKG